VFENKMDSWIEMQNRTGAPGRSTRGEVAHQAKWPPVVFQVLSAREGEGAPLSFYGSRGGMEVVSGCFLKECQHSAGLS